MFGQGVFQGEANMLDFNSSWEPPREESGEVAAFWRELKRVSQVQTELFHQLDDGTHPVDSSLAETLEDAACSMESLSEWARSLHLSRSI